VPHPKTVIVKDVLEAKAAADKIGYPVVVKPIIGFGGANVRLVKNSIELQRAFTEASLVGENVLVQSLLRVFTQAFLFWLLIKMLQFYP
jgi:biotin carboxylase